MMEKPKFREFGCSDPRNATLYATSLAIFICGPILDGLAIMMNTKHIKQAIYCIGLTTITAEFIEITTMMCITGWISGMYTYIYFEQYVGPLLDIGLLRLLFWLLAEYPDVEYCTIRLYLLYRTISMPRVFDLLNPCAGISVVMFIAGGLVGMEYIESEYKLTPAYLFLQLSMITTCSFKPLDDDQFWLRVLRRVVGRIVLLGLQLCFVIQFLVIMSYLLA